MAALQCERLDRALSGLRVKVVGYSRKTNMGVGSVDKRAKTLFSKFKATKHTAQWIFQTGVDEKHKQEERLKNHGKGKGKN